MDPLEVAMLDVHKDLGDEIFLHIFDQLCPNKLICIFFGAFKSYLNGVENDPFVGIICD